jgi:hypothetical protein
MKHFAEKHGEEAVRELFLNYVITQGNRQSSEVWRELCIRNGLCGKGTKIISMNMHNFVGELDQHMIRVLNGRGQYLVNVNVLDSELKEYLGE